MPHVLVAGKIHPAGIELLRSAPEFTVELISPVSVDSYAPFLPQADALLIRTQPLTAVEIASARQLKIVSRHGVGYDSVDIAALSARHIPLAVVGDVNSRSVAEHTLALLLALAKRVCYFDQAIRAGDWNSRNTFSAVELAERTLFILGFGRIGREVARLAQAFRMKVVAWDPYVADSAFADLGVARVRDIDAGLQEADAVTVHLPRVGDRPLIGRAELALLKPGALIINTARGGIIDEDALAGALAANHLGGAALDVLKCEPADLASALLEQKERLILTPHSAGLTGEAAMRMSVSAAQNIIDYFNECLEPSLVVNPEVLAINAVMNPLP
ncbi:D-isomer specific 2-hydroxyacid dehydrogenase family protein [Raoultella planticola]|uniref:D-isomer specific 2-hydroxyacid dehydrogenase family protein n=1 Tax=Raoultella planticola TaxID=575 RepID=A0A8G1ZWM9_RAOPL|nr:hydroxyacid dehydrogenase [Raoultella planticola]SAP38685.1 D-isomer specific 2-hydroxyacid dehydrogenase family protein [Raoultella planticola]HED2413319.1 hydroxyacid dehydrogenase [Raoultella planticola]